MANQEALAAYRKRKLENEIALELMAPTARSIIRTNKPHPTTQDQRKPGVVNDGGSRNTGKINYQNSSQDSQDVDQPLDLRKPVPHIIRALRAPSTFPNDTSISSPIYGRNITITLPQGTQSLPRYPTIQRLEGTEYQAEGLDDRDSAQFSNSTQQEDADTPLDLTLKLPNADIINQSLRDTLNFASFEPIRDVDSSVALMGAGNLFGEGWDTDEEDEENLLRDSKTTQCEANIKAIGQYLGDLPQQSNPGVQMVMRRPSAASDVSNANSSVRTDQQGSDLGKIFRDKIISQGYTDIGSWVESQRQMVQEVQHSRQLNQAFYAILRRWEQYINTSYAELQQVEYETARAMNSCEEVMNMLDDKDRYVWQLLEEFGPSQSPLLDNNQTIKVEENTIDNSVMHQNPNNTQ